MSAMRWRPVRPWQHWRFALTVTLCWLARRHFPRLDRTSDRGYRWYTCRVCRARYVDTRSRRTPAAEPCPYRAHYGDPCDCEARLTAVATHTRASTSVGPDYCQECSEAVSEWVPWPCPTTRPTPAPTEES